MPRSGDLLRFLSRGVLYTGLPRLRSRTAVSVGALITAVALFTSLVIMIHSFRRTVEIWTYQTVSGDLFLTTKLNEMNQFRHPVPPETAAWLQSLGKDVEVVPNRRFFLNYESHPFEFEVLDLDIFLKYADFFWMKGQPKMIRSRLKKGDGVIISEVFSNRTGVIVFYQRPCTFQLSR